MRVFVTGASGFIGCAVLPELIGAGHHVVGLARSDEAAAVVAAAGADVKRGTIDDLEVLRAGADGSDGVVHLAFKHDIAFSGGYLEAAEADRRAMQTFGELLEGSGRPLVIASGMGGLGTGGVATERDVAAPGHPLRARFENEELALSFAGRGVRSTSVRLPPTVHGEGDHAFVPRLIEVARSTGVSGYIGDGGNRWPAVHRLDAAAAFRLALEEAPPGSVLHAVADEGVPLRQVAEVIGRHLELPVVSIAPEQAAEHFGWIATILGADIPASSEITRQQTGWKPTHPGLIEDLEQGHYFAGGFA